MLRPSRPDQLCQKHYTYTHTALAQGCRTHRDTEYSFRVAVLMQNIGLAGILLVPAAVTGSWQTPASAGSNIAESGCHFQHRVQLSGDQLNVFIKCGDSLCCFFSLKCHAIKMARSSSLGLMRCSQTLWTFPCRDNGQSSE